MSSVQPTTNSPAINTLSSKQFPFCHLPSDLQVHIVVHYLNGRDITRASGTDQPSFSFFKMYLQCESVIYHTYVIRIICISKKRV